MTTETSEIDWDKTPAFEPGTLKRLGYRGEGHTYWPSVEEQVKAAQKHNLEVSFSKTHEHVPLYMFEGDCEHENPEEMEKYLEVEDLLEEWLAENHPEYSGENPHKRSSFSTDRDRSDYWKWYDRKWELQQEGRKEVPLYVEFNAAEEEYEANHNGVCLLEPMGSCCKYCNADELDYGEGVDGNFCIYGDRDQEAEQLWCKVDYDWMKSEYRKNRQQA